MPPSIVLELQVAAAAEGLPGREAIRGWLQDAVRDVLPDDGRTWEIVVRVVDEQESRDLNHRYRKQDKATNVLAFPAAVAGDLPAAADEIAGLGDLVLCGSVIAREAAAQGKDAEAHWGHMLVHGTLHLLGYDHGTEAEAARMEDIEKRLLAGRGIDDPYAPR